MTTTIPPVEPEILHREYETMSFDVVRVPHVERLLKETLFIDTNINY